MHRHCVCTTAVQTKTPQVWKPHFFCRSKKTLYVQCRRMIRCTMKTRIVSCALRSAASFKKTQIVSFIFSAQNFNDRILFTNFGAWHSCCLEKWLRDARKQCLLLNCMVSIDLLPSQQYQAETQCFGIPETAWVGYCVLACFLAEIWKLLCFGFGRQGCPWVHFVWPDPTQY